MLPRKQFSAWDFGFVHLAVLCLPPPHYRSVLTASLVSAASGSKSHQPPPPPMSGLHGRAPSFCHRTGSMPSVTHWPHEAEVQETTKYIGVPILHSWIQIDAVMQWSVKTGPSINELQLHAEWTELSLFLFFYIFFFLNTAEKKWDAGLNHKCAAVRLCLKKFHTVRE